MATRIAIAQRKQAAADRLRAAAAGLGLEPPPTTAKQDGETQIAVILEWAADALELAAGKIVTEPAPGASKRSRKAED